MLFGGRSNSFDRVGDDQGDGYRLTRGGAFALDPGKVEEVFDNSIDSDPLVVDALGESVGDRRVGLEQQGFGEQPERPHGRLQFVRHVRDEVATDVLEATTLGDVFDDRQDSQRSTAVVDDGGANREGPTWGSVNIDGALGDSVGPTFGEYVGDRLGGDGVAVATRHQRRGLLVSEDDAAALVTEDEPEGERVHGLAQARRVSAGLRYRWEERRAR